MKHLQSKAKRLLDRYLSGVRSAVSSSGRIDAFEVERDVRDHIEMALEGCTEPVTPRAMSRVLDRLGSPPVWVTGFDAEPETETKGAATADQTWRLAYLSFGLVVLALTLPAFLWVGLFAGFLCARASMCSTETGTDFGQRWLRFPALALIYGPLLAFGLLWPAIAMRVGADFVLESGLVHSLPSDIIAIAERLAAIRLSTFDPIVTAKLAVRSGHYLLAPIGLWLIVLGVFSRAWPSPVQFLLRPFVASGSNR